VNLQHLRLTLSLTGMLLAVAGVGFDQPILIWAAIGALALSLVVRIVLRRAAAKSTSPAAGDGTAS